MGRNWVRFNLTVNMKKSLMGFTLIELLIVIGILSILVVTILITLNPAEAQKKSRDVKRMKDLQTLQAIVEQWIADGNAPFCESICYSSEREGKTICSDNWLHYQDGTAVNLCRYTNSVPVDPANNQQRSKVSTYQAPEPQYFRYVLKMQGSDYEINSLQESVSSIGNIRNDGGNSGDWVEVGSKLDLLTGN